MSHVQENLPVVRASLGDLLGARQREFCRVEKGEKTSISCIFQKGCEAYIGLPHIQQSNDDLSLQTFLAGADSNQTHLVLLGVL